MIISTQQFYFDLREISAIPTFFESCYFNLMNILFLLITLSLCIAGLIFTITGYLQLDEGVPGWYSTRNIAELQSDANEILLGIGWILTGIASFMASLVSGAFMILFWPKK